MYPSTLLDVRTEGAVGDGATDNTIAFTAAISKAISIATSIVTPVTIYVPSGTYAISGDLPAITVGNIWIVGDSPDTSILLGSAGQKLLTWGAVGTAVYTGGIRSIGFRYANTPPCGACCISVVSGAIYISDISLLHVGTFITFGAYAADTGGGAFMESVHGYTYYGGSGTEGYPLINVLSGGGLWIHDWNVIVGGGGATGASPTYPAESPADSPDAYSTQHMIVGDGPHGAGITDYQLPGNRGARAGGINFLQIIPAGTSVDTIYMSNVLAQFFTCGVYAYCHGNAGSCAINFIEAINSAWDNCGSSAVALGGDSSGAWSINDISLTQCVATGWDHHGIVINSDEPDYGYLNNIQLSGCLTHDTGLEGLYLGAQVRNCIVNSLLVVNPNRFGAASGVNAVTVVGGATNFSFTGGCMGAPAAGSKATGHDGLSIGAGCASFVISGVSMRGVRHGLNLAAGSDHYSVTGNLFEGGIQPAFVGLDHHASMSRRVHDNSGHGYSGVRTGSPFIIPASSATWSNSTPFVLDIYIEGGEVSAASLNGSLIPGLKSGLIRLEPGGTYSLVYTIAPTVTYVAEA